LHDARAETPAVWSISILMSASSATKPLARKVDEVADDIRTRRAIDNLPVLRGYTETRHKAKSWDRERRTVARIEATMLGLDIVQADDPETAVSRIIELVKTRIPKRFGLDPIRDIQVVCTENLNPDVVMVKSTKYRG
jgi:hypothetical protein